MRFSDLNEGPNDPGIFKAIFLAGGPGSGKGYVAQQLGLQSRGLKVINSDDAFEYLMRKRDLSFDMPPEQQADRDIARQRAKEITTKKQDLYLDGRLGIIIDGTAKDPNKMAKLKAELESIGYQTMMVFVNTSLRTALQRNLLRDRKVPTDIVMQSHKQVQTNKDKLSDVFATNYVEVNNDDNANFNEPLKRIDKFISEPVTATARDWISKASVQKSIAQEDAQSKPKVYVDMDGVLANFYAGVTRVTGHEEPRDMALQDIEDTMASFKGTDFFYKLPKYEQTDQLIAMVNAATGGNWYILSSPLKYDREGSAKYKAAWIRDKLKIQPKDMYFQSDKAQFATQPDGTPNILIDDYPKYLNSWKDKGGIGVQYKGHAGNIEDVKATLDQYFGNTKPPEGKVAEALDSSYPYEFKNNAYYFITDAGNDYKAVFKGDKKVEVSFMARGENNQPKDDITGTGDSRKVFGTVVNIVKDYVGQHQPDILMFAADNNQPSRVRLYNMLAAQAGKSLPGYNFVKKLKSSLFTTFYLTRDNVKVPKLDTAKNLAGRALDKVFDSQHPKLPGKLLSELADNPYSYSQNVKTPDKRAYRFQTDAGQLYRVQVFNRRKDDANKLEIHFDLTDMKTGKPETGVTGTGDAVRVFSTVADILQKEVAAQDPTGVIIASKADDESRVKLYRRLARRATKLMPGYEVSGERTVTGASGDPYLTIELKKT